MRRLLVALLLLGPAFTGCVDGSFVEKVRDDLEAEDEYQQRELLAEEVPFSPTGVLDPNRTVEGDTEPAHKWNDTVLVPNGTRSLTVIFKINFTSTDGQEQLPENPPDGEVRVYVEGPSGKPERALTRTEPARAGFDFTTPKEGEWTVGMEARGNGSVTFKVDAIVPVATGAS